jgi:hypothetical protein
MPRIQAGPRKVDFNSVKKLVSRMQAPEESGIKISAHDKDVPAWQRNVVWTPEEMGLLALSIINNYPIGLVILWKKPDGIRVPIDGRQRLTAIEQFQAGLVAIPDLPGVPDAFKNRKYKRRDNDDPKYLELDLLDREEFDDYEPQIVEFENIDESTAMDIFIKLQGGKSLTKTEVRAALGGKVCDFVTELTSSPAPTTEDDEDENEPGSHHPFFQQVNVRNVRKAHRNLCDVLLHEELYSGTAKHWSGLETLYREKCDSLTESSKTTFKSHLGKFQRACSVSVNGQMKMLPQLRSAFLILTFYRAWREVEDVYAKPSGYSFAEVISEFEALRINNPKETPWVNFTSALSNAGYAQNRISERHDILMSFIMRKYPDMKPKDPTRTFGEAQKIAIWDRAGRRCEHEQDGTRCDEVFADFRIADADHIIRWVDGGSTTLDNGRLLCQAHNRGRAA